MDRKDFPPLPNFHDTYRKYREWMATCGPMADWKEEGWWWDGPDRPVIPENPGVGSKPKD
jgi:hypothetical protein